MGNAGGRILKKRVRRILNTLTVKNQGITQETIT
jgi:hypothetical protein